LMEIENNFDAEIRLVAALNKKIGKQKVIYKKAEEEINRAIALDPSDGEQGKYSRMEAYNVLSKIYRAKGNNEKADFFMEVMTAIRAGEIADDYLWLGLTQEAITRYRDALGHFEDAYCLQSRLAKAYLELGDLENAEIHFKKAFELMPVSFGPVESHCFGCEGIFKSELAQKIAAQVFQSVIESSPNNPRTYYLLAKLYEEQDKHDLAFPHYLKAFQLDKNYYNCAKRLYAWLLIAPSLKETHPNLMGEIMACYPYPRLDDLFKERADLKPAWQDAYKLAKSRTLPIELPLIPLPFSVEETEDMKSKDLIRERTRNLSRQHRSQFYPLDGWQGDELLRGNSLLSSFYF